MPTLNYSNTLTAGTKAVAHSPCAVNNCGVTESPRWAKWNASTSPYCDTITFSKTQGTVEICRNCYLRIIRAKTGTIEHTPCPVGNCGATKSPRWAKWNTSRPTYCDTVTFSETEKTVEICYNCYQRILRMKRKMTAHTPCAVDNCGATRSPRWITWDTFTHTDAMTFSKKPRVVEICYNCYQRTLRMKNKSMEHIPCAVDNCGATKSRRWAKWNTSQPTYSNTITFSKEQKIVEICYSCYVRILHAKTQAVAHIPCPADNCGATKSPRWTTWDTSNPTYCNTVTFSKAQGIVKVCNKCYQRICTERKKTTALAIASKKRAALLEVDEQPPPKRRTRHAADSEDALVVDLRQEAAALPIPTQISDIFPLRQPSPMLSDLPQDRSSAPFSIADPFLPPGPASPLLPDFPASAACSHFILGDVFPWTQLANPSLSPESPSFLPSSSDPINLCF